MKIDIEERVKRARKNFESGYNCSQSIVLAFADCYPIDQNTLLSISSSFGGGVGRLREICGAVSGMAMLAGMQLPNINPEDKDRKMANYALVQDLSLKFKEQCGSYICRELLELPEGTVDDPIPSERTKEYYKRRPCADLVAIAARIYAESLQETQNMNQ